MYDGAKKWFSKKPRAVGGSACDGRHVRRRVFEQLAQGVDGGARDRQHQLREEAKDHRLLLGEFGTEQAAEDVVVDLDDTGQHLLAITLIVVGKAIGLDVEQVQRRREGDVGRIDNQQPRGQRVRAIRIEQCEALDRIDHIALAVEDDHGGDIVGCALQIRNDQVLEKLRLAMAGSGENVHVLEACRLGEHERHRCSGAGSRRACPRDTW